MEVLTIVWFDSNCKGKDNSWNSKIKPRNLKEKFSFSLASVLFKFVCTALLLIFKCQRIVLWRTFLILLYIVDDVVSQENCCRAIIGVSAIVSRAAEPSDNLREAIFSYLRNYKLTAVLRRQCFSISWNKMVSLTSVKSEYQRKVRFFV